MPDQPLRAIDCHVHLPTPDWLDESMAGYVEAAEAYFRSKVSRRTLKELADDYEQIDTVAVLLAWDAETATGRPRVPNEVVAQACQDHPGRFVGFGSVDPLKGERAIAELDRIAELGLKGVKLHPSLQAFAPDDSRHWPLYERCQELGLAQLLRPPLEEALAGPVGLGPAVDPLAAPAGHGVTRPAAWPPAGRGPAPSPGRPSPRPPG